MRRSIKEADLSFTGRTHSGHDCILPSQSYIGLRSGLTGILSSPSPLLASEPSTLGTKKHKLWHASSTYT